MSNVAIRPKESFWERNRKSGGYLFKRKFKEVAGAIVRGVLLFGMCFLILQPLLNKLSSSFMAEEDLYNPMIISIPEHFTLNNYVLSLRFLDYWNSIGSTLVVALTIAVLQIAICTLVGYGFARFQFPLKKFWFACVILVIIIPPQTISTSLHLHFKFFDILGIISAIKGGQTINLSGSVLPYYLMSAGCMGLKNGLYIFMIRQFFRNIPKELEEAAYVDGCGMLKTFIRIMLPDAKPILTSCFLFSFVWQWTDSFYSNLFMGNVKLLSIELTRVAERLGQYVSKTLNMGGVSVGYSNCMVGTATLLVILPLFIIYLFAQKGFVESLSSSGIKM